MSYDERYCGECGMQQDQNLTEYVDGKSVVVGKVHPNG